MRLADIIELRKKDTPLVVTRPEKHAVASSGSILSTSPSVTNSTELTFLKTDANARSSTTPAFSMFDTIRTESSGRLSESQVIAMMRLYPTHIASIRNEPDPLVRRKMVHDLVNTFSLIVKSSTRKVLARCCGVLLDGLIHDAARGRPDSQIVFAFRHGQLYCAKVGEAASMRHEYEVAQRISTACEHCPTISPILELLDLPPSAAQIFSRAAVIMPLYPLSISAHLPEFAPPEFIANVALCTAASIKGFELAGLAH